MTRAPSRPGRRPRAPDRRAASASTPSWSIAGAVLPAAALDHDRDLAQDHGRDPARQHPRPAARPDLRALDHGLVRGLHRAQLQRHPRRLLELGADPDPLGDPLDPGRRADRLRALSFWRVRGADLLFGDPADRRLHPLPGLPLSAGAHLLGGRHLQLAARHRHHPHHLRPADHDAAVPQLLRVAAASSCSRRRASTAAASGRSSGGSCCRCRRRC